MRNVYPSLANLIILVSNWLIQVYEELEEDIIEGLVEKFWETQDLVYVEELCDMFITIADHVTTEEIEYFRNTRKYHSFF